MHGENQPANAEVFPVTAGNASAFAGQEKMVSFFPRNNAERNKASKKNIKEKKRRKSLVWLDYQNANSLTCDIIPLIASDIHAFPTSYCSLRALSRSFSVKRCIWIRNHWHTLPPPLVFQELSIFFLFEQNPTPSPAVPSPHSTQNLL